MPFNESTIEQAALSWFGELGYAVARGPDLAPGEAAAERASFGDVVLAGRLAKLAIGGAVSSGTRRGAARVTRCCSTPGW